jgi:hypothetical protein
LPETEAPFAVAVRQPRDGDGGTGTVDEPPVCAS